jgi:predicted GTPase
VERKEFSVIDTGGYIVDLMIEGETKQVELALMKPMLSFCVDVEEGIPNG